MSGDKVSGVNHYLQQWGDLSSSSGASCTAMHRGTLYVRVGPMYSDKSTWLNTELTRFADRGFPVLKITHSNDVRDDVASCDNSGSTHNSSFTSLTKKIDCVRSNTLANINVDKYDVIGVDEGQFFSDYDDFYNTIENWVERLGKHVRVVGLDGDFKKEKFGHVVDLCRLSDDFMKLKGACRTCLDELQKIGFRGNILAIEGCFTKHIGELPTGQVDVGGANKYSVACRYHHSN